ncbi:hypothetical protein [Undibacterium parvum]|uniref:hypothetical protein n=1 Tax=Undibacterium parvum TaxID=401471 RepID=UPI00130050F6|nr:hypothetical protein [Undibacterium parvum]
MQHLNRHIRAGFVLLALFIATTSLVFVLATSGLAQALSKMAVVKASVNCVSFFE